MTQAYTVYSITLPLHIVHTFGILSPCEFFSLNLPFLAMASWLFRNVSEAAEAIAEALRQNVSNP